jgi:predicted MPP superfamily phosphohydrolase
MGKKGKGKQLGENVRYLNVNKELGQVGSKFRLCCPGGIYYV